MATPSKTYATNWAYFSGVFTWIIIVPIINKFYIPFFSKLNVTSAYEYLESRFNVVIRLLGSSFYCVFQVVGRMGVVLFLPSLALSSVTDISAPICIVVMGFLATIYTITGGMEAVIWTDVMQTIVLFGGAIFCITEVISELDGGSSQFIQVAFSENKFSLGGTELSYTAAVLWVVLVGNVFNRLGTYSSDQSVVQRYQTTESGEQARRSLWANVVASVPWAIIIYGLGTALFVFYKSQPEKISPTVTADGVVPFFIANNLPVGVSGIVIAGILAASMSSLDSSMHSVATVLVVDFFERFFPNLAGDAEKLKGARWLVGVLGILGTGVALVLALADLMSIWDFFLEYLGLLTGSLAGLFALGIFSERAHGTGALVGVSSSLVLVLYTKFFTDVHFLLYGVVSFLSCLLIGYFSSLFTTGKGRTSGLTVYTISRKVEP